MTTARELPLAVRPATIGVMRWLAPLVLLSLASTMALAKGQRGIPVYTIGAGRDGFVPVPVFDNNGRRVGTRQMMSDLDEGALRELANTTNGKFFRAADNDTVEGAFKSIDQTQKIEFQAKSYLVTTELFWWLAMPGLAILAMAAAVGRPIWRREAFA